MAMKPPPPPFILRITGKSRDGMIVTLGRYRTQAEADADHAQFKREGFYKDLQVHEIPPAPPAAPGPTA